MTPKQEIETETVPAVYDPDILHKFMSMLLRVKSNIEQVLSLPLQANEWQLSFVDLFDYHGMFIYLSNELKVQTV